ncbi:MAG: hypothetical protein ACREOZ_02680, partial [Gloeomargaritales cyanobacterium]
MLKIGTQEGKLHRPLGKWNRSRTSQEDRILVSDNKRVLYCKRNNEWTAHQVEGGLRRLTFCLQGKECEMPTNGLSASAKKGTKNWTDVLWRGVQSQPFTREALTLREVLTQLPKTEKRILGSYKVPVDQGKDIAQTFRKSIVEAASDRSVMLGRGAHAWCIQGSNSEDDIEGAGPVDGDPIRMSSYRAELHGVAAILVATKQILKFQKSNGPLAGHLEIYCDNKAVIQFGRQKPRVWSVSTANAPEFDILNTVREILDELPIQVRFKWVKGHQSTFPMTREAYLNSLMDEKAKAFLTSPSTGLHPQKCAFHFPRAKISFMSNGQRNTTHLREQIYT